MAPHYIAGLSLGEWVSIIGIITFISGLISMLFKYAVFGPLRAEIERLSNTIEGLDGSLKKIRNDYEKLEERVDNHDRRLDRHDEKFKTLFNDKYKKEDK